ncbi:MAG: LON peptidase substrate-binding domain-containing protein [Mariniblastus sp.]|nr:LON peptidase substrate-binding domain-containing protein [Mariniblastus sp.]
MSFSNVNLALPPNFSGLVRLFPLPNLVLFPGVIQGLHIFEPRYRELMEDALAADELITVSLLKPEWELSGSENVPIHETVCVGKIVTHTETEDGRYNLLLIGLRRARIVREIHSEKPYRLAQVEILNEPKVEDPAQLDLLRDKLLKQFRTFAESRNLLENESIQQLLAKDVPFGLLADLIGFSTGASCHQLQDVLETVNLEARGQKVLDLMRDCSTDVQNHDGDFPPRFSAN